MGVADEDGLEDGRRTVLETGQTASQSRSLVLDGVGAVGFAAAGLEGLELPADLQGSEIELVVLHPQRPHGVDPAGSHGLDVGPFLGDMAVLGGVVVADDEVGDVGGQIVLVDAAHVGSALGNLALYMDQTTYQSTRKQDQTNAAAAIYFIYLHVDLPRYSCSRARGHERAGTSRRSRRHGRMWVVIA